ncbi:MAG TPA: tyrosine-type recombinase/integrase, partial [Blastocatellia bacterium]
MSEALIVSTENQSAGGEMAQFVDRVCDGLQSQHSQRAYKRAIKAFVAFLGTRREPLSKALMNEWKMAMRLSGSGEAAINNALSAARFFLREAADNGLLDRAAVESAVKVTNIRQRGTRAGNWLTRDQAERILQAPDTSTALGTRDRAILGVMIGSGLRRSEVAALTVEHFQQRDGRWCVVDIRGKRNKVRTVPVPAFTKALLDLWTGAANITSGPVWRQASWSKDKFVVSDTPLSDKGVARVCRRYGLLIDAPRIAAHDLR